MAEEAAGILVSPDWLKERLDAPNLVVVEASFYLPDEGKDAEALFEKGHIRGAVRFDVDKVADTSSSLPHMLPNAGAFSAMMGKLGIGRDKIIVIYDATDHLGGARAWWMLKHYGAPHVHVLEGGYGAWAAAGYPTDTGKADRAPEPFHARFESALVADSDAVLTASTKRTSQIVDARAKARFEGSAPEPRAGLRSGHIPGSANVPWRSVLDSNGRFLSPGQIIEVFGKAGIDSDRPLIASCGSGVSAAVLILALERAGKTGTKLYDGSWSEWGGRHDLPVETGPARS